MKPYSTFMIVILAVGLAQSSNAATIVISNDTFETMAANGISADATQEANSAWMDVTGKYRADQGNSGNQNARTDVGGFDGTNYGSVGSGVAFGDAGRGLRVRSSTGAATLDSAMQLVTLNASSLTIAFDLQENTASYVLALQYSSTADFAAPVEIDRYVGLGANALDSWVAKSYTLTDGVGGITFTDTAYFMIRKLSVAGTQGGINSTFHYFDNIVISAETPAVPEPSIALLGGLGLIGLLRRRRA
jgi:MYXO-CTERM domain-containing protein